MAMKQVKFSIIGAGSVSFCPATVSDILLSEKFRKVPVKISLMDVNETALQVSEGFTRKAMKLAGIDNVEVSSTTSLDKSLEGADFVVTAIEVNRYYYWSMDFHIPRRYGFRQVYGENGGPGGMFHFLRNLPPLLNIARAMERICPDAWLLNYTNPEAKLVEAISKLTKVKTVGLCHGEAMGRDQLSEILEMPLDQIKTQAVGLNHFGWFTSIQDKKTGKDLYPLLREKERSMDWLAHWDELGLTRLMFRTFGLYSYPGTNHIGEYIGWSDEMLASAKIQYFYDPVVNDPWKGGKVPEFVYSFAANPTARPLFASKDSHDVGDPAYQTRFSLKEGKLNPSHEFGIPIAEAIAFDISTEIGAVNVINKGYSPDLKPNMAIEIPATVDGRGIHPHQVPALPTAIAQMINVQGTIHELLIEAYQEESRNKLLQALLIDPTISTYNNAVALINEMCERQSEILPKLKW